MLWYVTFDSPLFLIVNRFSYPTRIFRGPAIYYIIGIATAVIGVIGWFIIEDAPDLQRSSQPITQVLAYSFRPSTVKANKKLYAVLAAFAVFGISIQVFMPYLIIYYEKTLRMPNYVLIMAPAIIVAAVVTALYGRVYDSKGFEKSIVPSLAMLMLGYVLLFFFRSTVPVFAGSLLMMSGYLTGMSVFGARIRDLIPENRSGQFQGVRIIGQVFIPGLIGPYIGAAVLRNAETIINSDGTESFLPNANIWLASMIVAVALCAVLAVINREKKA